jgi:ankyrin repeat protein
MLKTTLDANPNIDTRVDNGTTPLHNACSAPSDSVDVVQALLKRLLRSRRNLETNILETPVHHAAAEGSKSLSIYLECHTTSMLRTWRGSRR